MKIPLLYRKRLIPSECFLLKDDIVLYRDEGIIITKWNTLRPRQDLHHGFSCYFLHKDVKVSKFYDKKNQLVCWYCDIVTHTWDPQTDSYVFTDLLADVVVYPDGSVKTLDLDELADAAEQGMLSESLLYQALRRTNWLLNLVYTGRFGELQQVFTPYC